MNEEKDVSDECMPTVLTDERLQEIIDYVYNDGYCLENKKLRRE